MAKHLYIIAGCDGAGKTTASMTILPKTFFVKEFVSAEEIARGLSPLNPKGVVGEAKRVTLKRILSLLDSEKSFAVETTLSTRSYIHLVQKAHVYGYTVHLIYFWLNTPQLAAERVAERVGKGGHPIPHDLILRRYSKSIGYLFKLYMREVDSWAIYDNSECKREIIATGGKYMSPHVYAADKLGQMRGERLWNLPKADKKPLFLKAIANKNINKYFKKLDAGMALAEQEMLREKALRGESVVCSDKEGNITHTLAIDVLAGKMSGGNEV